MDSSPLSLQLTREVLAATAVQNWDALEVLDRKLAQHLASLGILSEREKAALLALRKRMRRHTRRVPTKSIAWACSWARYIRNKKAGSRMRLKMPCIKNENPA